MFYDEVKVFLKSGDGGDGSAAMRRAKYVPKGGPDGGDGGRGGDLILRCDENIGDLRDFHFRPIWKAKNGEPGRGKQQHGKGAPALVLKVPVGTVLSRLHDGKIVAELDKHGDERVFMKGGKGGMGNIHFKSSTNQAPRQTTPGEEGREGDFLMELKSIADIGLVGFPNAGKSSFVGIITHAQPKVGHYAFTTLNPSIGTIEYPDHYSKLKMADIPGLVEGAHENRGLGHRFLKHIERCKTLLFMVDMQGSDGRDPLANVTQLRKELKLYNPELLEKHWIIAANKMDEPDALKNLRRLKSSRRRVPIFPISCLSEEGIPELKQALWDYCRELCKVVS